MRTGGFFGAEVIAWFNGGLFDDAPPLPLERADLKLIADTAAEHDWSQIDPAIFGTLFEEALKSTRQRAALGAHYTDRDKILKIVDPVITRPLAAEWDVAHAEIRLWIGDLQWMRKNGFVAYAEPILSTLDAIENRDALLNPDGTEAEWPAVDVIIGNPPFLGGKRLRDGLGDEQVERLFAAFRDRVPAEADFVVYWVVKAWEATRAGRAERAGLVTTNSIRGGANRRAVAPIADAGALMEAWADEPWVLEGAAVRVSMLGLGRGFQERGLNGAPTVRINGDLTGAVSDLTKAARLDENADVAFMGDTKGGAFDIVRGEWFRALCCCASKPELDAHRPFDAGEVMLRKRADASARAKLGRGRDLVRHSLAALSPQGDIGFAGLEPVHVRRERHDLNTVQGGVRGVIAHNHRWPGLAHLAADGWVEGNPRDLPTNRFRRHRARRRRSGPRPRR
jgi:type II restriction/modification system DNA methylase subunit YeeA